MVRLEKGSTLSQQQKKRSRSSLDYKKPKQSHQEQSSNTIMVPEYYDDLQKLSSAEIRELLKTHPELGSLVEQETPRLQQKYREEESSIPPPPPRPPQQARKQESNHQRTKPRKKTKVLTAEEDREFPYVQWMTLLLLLVASLLYYFYKPNKQNKKKQQRPRKLRISEEKLVQDLNTADVVVVPQQRPPKTKRSVRSQRTKKVKPVTAVETVVTKTTTTVAVTPPPIIETADFEVGEWTTVGKKTKEEGRTRRIIPAVKQQVLVETIPENGSKRNGETKNGKTPVENGDAVHTPEEVGGSVEKDTAADLVDSEIIEKKKTDPATTPEQTSSTTQEETAETATPVETVATKTPEEAAETATPEQIANTAQEQTPVADDSEFTKPKSKKKKKKAKQNDIPQEQAPLPETTTDNDAALAIQLQMEEERLADVAVEDTAATEDTTDEWEEVTKKKTKKS